LAFGAIDYLAEHVRPGDRVFEYGSGGSTLFLADLGAQVTAVEHDPQWQTLVMQEFARLDDSERVHVGLMEPALAAQGDAEYRSASPDWRGWSFRDYVEAIRTFPDDHFDWVMVDGRARVACIRSSAAKLKPGAAMVVDNTDRAEYQTQIEELVRFGWVRSDFRGPAPSLLNFTCTSVLRRPR
jgi:tRNA A58 N-methylase Trm61